MLVSGIYGNPPHLKKHDKMRIKYALKLLGRVPARRKRQARRVRGCARADVPQHIPHDMRAGYYSEKYRH